MMLTADQTVLLASITAVDEERTAAKLLGSLWEFIRFFWHIVEPRKKFQDNWHIHVECAHLEALYQGKFRNLIFNVPPGTSKSTIVSVMFPAWCWAHDPGHRIFGASYNEPLAIRDAMLCRAIILSPDFQRMFPDVRIKSGNDQKTQYGLESGGWRIASSVGGRGTGEHPDIKIIDDPHNVKQSESDVERERGLNWYDGTLASRGVIHDAMTILIMQRLHSVDLTGHIMRSLDYVEGDWVHVIIPMEYEPYRELPKHHPAVEWHDPRRKAGDLLWPAAFTRRKVELLKIRLGQYRAAGQLQQRPAPAGGGILRTENFKLWPANVPLPDIFHVVQSYDTAYTDKTANDPSACTTWGMFILGEKKRCALLLDAWSENMNYPELRTKMMADWKAEYGGIKGDLAHPARKADIVLIEDKGSGITVIQELRRANVPVLAYNPGRASKTARAQIASAVLDAEVLYVIESRRESGKPVTWARPLLTQCEEFPNSEHDDLVDTFTQAVIYMQHADVLETSSVEDEEETERDYAEERRSRTNPYGA